MVEEVQNHSNNLAKQQHVQRLSNEIYSHKEQLGNVIEALPVIRKRVNTIDQTIHKLSSTLPEGKICLPRIWCLKIATQYDFSHIFSDCSHIKENGVHLLQIDGIPAPIHVLCDNGNTVIQNRFDGMESFNRSWLDYKEGFGHPEKGDLIVNVIVVLVFRNELFWKVFGKKRFLNLYADTQC